MNRLRAITPLIVALLSVTVCLCTPAHAQDQHANKATYKTDRDIPYRSGENLTDYMRQRCRLDVYAPESKNGFSTVVWFHGGGLKGGKKSVPKELKEQGVAVVAVNYRLHPKVTSPAYIEDAAAAVAWTFKNIEKYGGSNQKIFISGHSAG